MIMLRRVVTRRVDAEHKASVSEVAGLDPDDNKVDNAEKSGDKKGGR